MHKKCFFCGSKDLVKDGFINGHQRLLCKSCGKRFIDRKRLDINKLYCEYLEGKQTISQLADKYRLSTRTIGRYLAKYEVSNGQEEATQDVVLLMDATYWTQWKGVLVFKDAITSKIVKSCVAHGEA